MATWRYGATLVADMLATFLVQQLDPIEKRPTLHDLLQRLKVLCRCSQKIKSGLGQLGYFLFLYQCNTMHGSRFAAALLTLPGPTLVLPAYTSIMTPSECDQVKLHW